MEHIYGITIDPSVKYRNEIENIADKITKKKAAREFFGKSPFITPDKNFFILQANMASNDQLFLGYNEIPQGAQISLTLKNQNVDQSKFESVSELAQDCSKIVTSHLGVEISRVGSVHKFTLYTPNVRQKLLDNFVIDFMDDRDNFAGGIYRFLYREQPFGLPELNINIVLEAAEANDAISVEVDINNKVLGGVTSDKIHEIGTFSRSFIENRLYKILREKGLM